MSVVGIFLNPDAVWRLVEPVLVERHGGRQVGQWYSSLESMRKLYEPAQEHLTLSPPSSYRRSTEMRTRGVWERGPRYPVPPPPQPPGRLGLIELIMDHRICST